MAFGNYCCPFQLRYALRNIKRTDWFVTHFHKRLLCITTTIILIHIIVAVAVAVAIYDYASYLTSQLVCLFVGLYDNVNINTSTPEN